MRWTMLLPLPVLATAAAGMVGPAAAGKAQLLPTNLQSRLPENSAPYTSTVVMPNPKTSAGAACDFVTKLYRDEFVFV